MLIFVFTNRLLHEFTCRNKKRVSLLYRTATTIYLCYLPVLEGSMGAGRIGLTHIIVVELTGVEPVSKQETNMLSTCLSDY